MSSTSLRGEFDARSIGNYVDTSSTSMRACEATGYAAVFATVAATGETAPCARSIAADIEIFSTAMRRTAT